MRWLRSILARIDRFTLVVTLAGLALAGLVLASVVVIFGLYNVSAKVGHMPGVAWLMHTVFRNSVELRAGQAEPPADLGSSAMVALGAGHYEQACSMCHGRPGQMRPATVRAMEPAPPHIVRAVEGWDAQELHWIVHQGVKMTGMPAWPALREDDVWPVVAFLRQIAWIDAADYDRLTGGPDRGTCAMCHGKGGRSTNPRVPRLDILTPEYIALSLRAYRAGRRDSGIMAQAASGLGDQAIRRLSTSFPPPPDRDFAPRMAGSVAEALAGKGSVSIPSCRACHGPWPEALNPAFPSLSGQHSPYLHQQLRLWRDGPRGGGPMADLMHKAAQGLSDADIAALADYYASLPPARLNEQIH